MIELSSRIHLSRWKTHILLAVWQPEKGKKKLEYKYTGETFKNSFCNQDRSAMKKNTQLRRGECKMTDR